ncbi:hypothetical protein [Mycoplasma crocodyli]|uniref:Uncharacterized protein n=1 Tax=Mycoplasma crocodyli (strain ATCC 51981 / MP145) TaxID=512564 RepID=D5E5H6_MYCCM|nr:hypothetical protein [Mycoplasma crocodyli]ADE19927.1 hypothetical protein MCRO_0384 [Mycoplasma crocodyli MP145]
MNNENQIKDNKLIIERREELKVLHDKCLSGLYDHKIDPSLIKYNKKGEQKLLNINTVKLTKKDIVLKIMYIILTILIIATILTLAYVFKPGV